MMQLSKSAARSARLALAEACRSALESTTAAAAQCALETAAHSVVRLQMAGLLAGTELAAWEAAKQHRAAL